MVMRKRKQSLVLFAVYVICLLGRLCVFGQAETFRPENEFHVGIVVDMGSREGKIIQSCVSMAISDFYSLQREQKGRIVLHTRDSKGDPLHALSTAFDLLENDKVGVILSAQTSKLEAKFLAELGDKTKIPIISFSSFGSSPFLHNYLYFIQIAQDETAEVAGIVATIELQSWQNVILIYEDDDKYWSDLFEERKFQIAYRAALATSSTDDRIIEELHRLRDMETKVLVVHVSHLLASRIFLNAKRMGMMSKGYAWIVTSKNMNQLDLTDSSTIESMQGVIGFRSYIKESEELHIFTSRLRKELYNKEPGMPESTHPSLHGVWAYDVAWTLANAINRMVPGVPEISQPYGRLDSVDFNNLITSIHSSILMREVFQNKLKGLGGEFQFIDGKLISSTFEIVNVIGDGQRRVGLWSSTPKTTKSLHGFINHGRHLSSINDLERVTWPGGTTSKPKGWMMQMSGDQILKVGVPKLKGFTELVKVDKDPQTNDSTVTGFCIDVFKAAVDGLNLKYEFIPMEEYFNGEKKTNYTYVVCDAFLKHKYHAIIGDITINAKRSQCGDFTLPYTDLGVGMIVPKEKDNMWIFLKPLRGELWLTMVGIYLLTTFIIWLIERPAPGEQRPQSDNYHVGRIFWFSFSILVFAQWEKLSRNLSRTVFVMWVFVVFILSSSYTATLTSMMTVQQIQLNSKRNNIGLQTDSVITQEVINNQKFKNPSSIWFFSPQVYIDSFSNGSVSAIVDEIPYINIFLANHSADYSMVGSMSTTNGFGFVFPRGSALVPNISREIARLRENGTLQDIENTWFNTISTSFASDETSESNSVNPLTIGDFGGLFLIYGTITGLAFLLHLASVLYRNWHIVRDCWRQPGFVKQYIVSMAILKIITESNVIHPDPI